MARYRPLARVVAVVSLLLAAAPLPARAEPAPLAELLAARGIQPIEPPTAAPDFTLPLLAGGEGDLSASHGSWVILTFFATWCGPCRSEMPTLERLHRARRDLDVLAVSVDRRREPVEPFVEEHGLTLPVFWDHRGEVGNAYRATSIPLSYIIDPSGRIVGLARGARDWTAAAELFDRLAEAAPAALDAPSHYARLDELALPEVLEPPTAKWSMPAGALRPGRPFALEVRLSWSGRLEDYLPQPPQIALPEGVTRGQVAASTSSLDGSHLVRYRIELTAAAAGVYALDPIELRYLPALGDGPVAARVAGPTIEVSAAGLAGATTTTLAVLAVGLTLAGLLLHRRRRRAGKEGDETERVERLRRALDRAKAMRLDGRSGDGYAALVAVARELETAEERRELERRLESVRFGGEAPDGAELEAIERRLERRLAALTPDPDAERRRRLRLDTRSTDSTPRTSKETTG